MAIFSQNSNIFVRFFQKISIIAILYFSLIDHGYAELVLKKEISQAVIKVSILDVFLLPIKQFLIANGDVTPRPSAYAPEYGQAGYYESYYGKVDPQGKRTTLNAWLEENDFNEYPALIKKAEYINAADLGFGRKMHCIDNGRTSCYVKNYLDPKGASTFAATVAMERMSNGYSSFVAYFVYDANGNRINQIPLDSEGPKSVPESCWACHGGYGHGSYYGGTYLPFDVSNLEDWPGHPTKAAQAEKFRELNNIVWNDAKYYADDTNSYLANPENLVNLIEKWYAGTPSVGHTFSKANAPSNWFTNVNGNSSTNANVYKKHQVESYMYKEIYGKYCRMCHVAQNLDWQDAHAADFTLAAYNHICSSKDPVMPHAEVTYNDFHNKFQHVMPRLTPLTIASVDSSLVSTLNLSAQLATNRALTTATIEATEVNGINIGDLTLANKFSGYQMLCQQLPLSIPAGNKVEGSSSFSSRCSGCHYVGGAYQNKVGGDLECRGAWLRQNMGSVNSVMNAIQLNLQEIQNISRHLNDRPNCN
jgi:hypothetical protein